MKLLVFTTIRYAKRKIEEDPFSFLESQPVASIETVSSGSEYQHVVVAIFAISKMNVWPKGKNCSA